MTPNAKLSTELSFILPVARNGVKLQMDWIRKQCSLLEVNFNLSHSNKHTRLNTSSIQHAYASTTHQPQPTLKANRHLTIGDKKATGGSTVSACETDHTLLWRCWKTEHGAVCEGVIYFEFCHLQHFHFPWINNPSTFLHGGILAHDVGSVAFIKTFPCHATPTTQCTQWLLLCMSGLHD